MESLWSLGLLTAPLNTHLIPLISAWMGHWLPSQAIVQPFSGVASWEDLLVIKPWINVLQMGFLLMNRKGFGSWETVSAGTIQACNVCFHFHIIVCLSISRLPRPQLANDNQLQMQVYPLGFILSWKKCVKFLDCLSWLVPIQRLSHNISLERHSALAEPMGEFQPHRTVTLLQGTGELQSFSQGLAWPAILTGWLLLAPSRVLSFDTIDIWGQDNLLWGVSCPIHCRIFNSIHALET